MIIGDPTIFAIESEIRRAYERLSIRALGLFVIHINGHRYGTYRSDATFLANSFDEVGNRISHRGQHTAPFAAELNAGKIADSFLNAIYSEKQDDSFFGIPLVEFSSFFQRNLNDLMWAPDGDEAFDDGSYVLQFDVQDRVRLIAFKSGENDCHDPNTLSDLWLPADAFYNVLQEWYNAFEAEWMTAKPKTSEADHGQGAGSIS